MTKRVIMLIPLGKNIGLTTVSLGLIESLHQKKVVVRFLKSLVENFNIKNVDIDDTSKIIRDANFVDYIDPFIADINSNYSLSQNRQKIIDYVLSKIFDKNIKYDVLLIEGINIRPENFLVFSEINYDIAKSLNAEIIFFCSLEKNNFFNTNNVINIINRVFRKDTNLNIKGIIVNEIMVNQMNNLISFNLFDIFQFTDKRIRSDFFHHKLLFEKNNIKILGCIPWFNKLIQPLVKDVCCKYLNANIIQYSSVDFKYIKKFFIYDENEIFDRTINLDYSLIIVSNVFSSSKIKILFNYIKNNSLISAVLLTSFSNSNKRYNDIMSIFKKLDFTIYITSDNILTVISLLYKFNFKCSNSIDRLNMIRNYIPKYIDINWIRFTKSVDFFVKYKYPTPPLFIYSLKKLAKKSMKHILLPEGNELRIIKAASICASSNLAYCTLLGNPSEIRNIAISNNIVLNSNVTILDPKLIRKNYVERLLYLRKKNNITTFQANELVKDDSILSTLLLEAQEVDGVVSGSVNTTSSTILPALQLIKTSKNSSLISSVFFMLLPDHVVLYSDCAININPTAIQLSEIAIQSSNTASLFGIESKIAMLSYSTGSSGLGSSVDKVKNATEITRLSRPDLVIDGPIQYDAAVSEIVSKLKCSNSFISGKATIFIFPDLDAGNITYKAVQRSTGVIAIGPILQGINRPVNDLSRGSSVQDIIYTIAVTAVQSGSNII
ncbi:MAG: phosphate acetyltransferase [Buchnera aphidicola (Chaetogeoica yunlongensis)]